MDMSRRRAGTRNCRMPKLKTKSGAKKRFGRTATGKIKAQRRLQAPSADQQAQAEEAQGARHGDPGEGRQQARPDLHAVSAGLSHGARQTRGDDPRPPQKGPRARQGLSRPRLDRLSHRDRKGREGAALRLSRPPQQEARFPRAVDPADQRRRARARADLFAIHARAEARRARSRPQGVVRPRDPRAGGVRRDRHDRALGARQSRTRG